MCPSHTTDLHISPVFNKPCLWVLQHSNTLFILQPAFELHFLCAALFPPVVMPSIGRPEWAAFALQCTSHTGFSPLLVPCRGLSAGSSKRVPTGP